MKLGLSTVVLLVFFLLCLYMVKATIQGTKTLITERVNVYEKISNQQP